MNRSVNIISFFIFVVYALMITIVTYDLSVSDFSLRAMPYKFEIFTGFALLIMLFGAVRIVRRWQGVRDIKKFGSFIYETITSPQALQYARLLTAIEIIFASAALLYCTQLINLNAEQVIPMIIVLAVLLVEMIFFLGFIKASTGAFKLGVGEEVLACFNREMHLYFYSGLKRVDLHSKEIISFTYRDGLNLTLPTNQIPPDQREAFCNALIQVLEPKNVYIDDALRNWK